MIKIAYIKSDDRYYNIERVLSLVKTEITSSLKKAARVVVKPCCVSDKVPLAATHVDALVALLNFIRPYVKGQITLAEGSRVGNTLNAMKTFGYLDIQDEFDLAICDLNNDEYIEIPLLKDDGKESLFKISKTMCDSDYIISLAPPKTDENILYNGAIANSAEPSLIGRNQSGVSRFFRQEKNYKTIFEQNKKVMAENLHRLIDLSMPSLAILDGYTAMQGNGPIEGEMVPTHFAVASTDSVAADIFTAEIMGLEINNIPYLYDLCKDKRHNFFVIGDDWQKNILKFKLPDSFLPIRHSDSLLI